MSLPTVEKKKRKSGSKTRTGCHTCKIRRVKCDEARPSCNRCTSTGRRCDGYSSDILFFPTEFPATATTIQQISNRLPGSAQEKRGFQYFITRTAAELTGYFSSEFWDHFILQVSSAEPALRHAVIAIGALHEEFANRNLKAVQAESVNLRQRYETTFATNQYTKAIAHLRKSLDNEKQAPLTALMSCVLFVVFESLRGSFDAAMLHLRSGIKIMEDIRRRSQNSGEESFIIENRIVPLFTRLSLQAILYIDTKKGDERRKLAKELDMIEDKRTPWKGEFKSLEEAREGLSRAASMLTRSFNLSSEMKAMRQNPPEILEMMMIAKARLTEWGPKFDTFMSKYASTLNARQIRGAALLKIHHATGTIMCTMTPLENDPRPIAVVVNDPAAFAPLMPLFQTILNLSRSLISAAEQDVKSGKPSLTFSADLGVVASLYYLCTRCTIKTMREEAFALLARCPRREGMWDTEIMDVIQRYWELEEEHKKMNPTPDHGKSFTEMVALICSDSGKWELVPREGLNSSEVPESRPRLVAEGEIDWFALLQSQHARGGLFESRYDEMRSSKWSV